MLYERSTWCQILRHERDNWLLLCKRPGPDKLPWLRPGRSFNNGIPYGSLRHLRPSRHENMRSYVRGGMHRVPSNNGRPYVPFTNGIPYASYGSNNRNSYVFNGSSISTYRPLLLSQRFWARVTSDGRLHEQESRLPLRQHDGHPFSKSCLNLPYRMWHQR